jgi:hypothetical protein
MVSMPVPAVKGTTMRTLWVGQGAAAWACAAKGNKEDARASRPKAEFFSLKFMVCLVSKVNTGLKQL